MNSNAKVLLIIKARMNHFFSNPSLVDCEGHSLAKTKEIVSKQNTNKADSRLNNVRGEK